MKRARLGHWVGPVRWGNCLLQGVGFWIRHANHIVRPMVRRRRGALFPHLLFVTRRDRVWHFSRLERRRFPPWWRGRFHCLSRRSLPSL